MMNMKNKIRANPEGDILYGLTLFGIMIYYIATTAGLWMGFLGFLKALAWPAILMYEAINIIYF